MPRIDRKSRTLESKARRRSHRDDDDDEEESESPRRRSPKKKSEERTEGWGAVVKRQKEAAERKEAAENTVRDFWLADGESAIIQFLDDEPYCYDAHNVKNSSGKWTVVPCQLATSKKCLICREGIKTTWRAAFKIADYRGRWDTEKKRFKHDEPVVKVWKVGPTLAQQIKNVMDKKGKDLTELVLEVSRSGEGKEATYNFETAFDDRDRRMKPQDIEDETPSTEELCAPPSDDELDKMGFYGED